MNINSFNFNEQPFIAKAIEACLLCLVAVWGGGYRFLVADKKDELVVAEMEEKQLKQDIKLKQKQMMNMDSYKDQIQETEAALSLQLQQLPTKSEVAELLSDISRAGLANGLAFDLFRPGKVHESQELDFYAELPLTIKITGTYHQLGHFVSELASLPRIVTLHNFTIAPAKETNQKSGTVTMTVAAKTYHYSN